MGWSYPSSLILSQGFTRRALRFFWLLFRLVFLLLFLVVFLVVLFLVVAPRVVLPVFLRVVFLLAINSLPFHINYDIM